ncbi:ATP-grasp peptide maturase system methyltransferase [Streptomyces albus]|uniref:ATP-grasp peptide maturase system methyltransferase n=1 Tax=Streptomyces TaxID=1883 RepID=UPI0004BD10C6|nr:MULTISPECIES: ATP-grasp peptide maturase system methyltransferase [Streptomyces]KPC67862.1 methyltransferase [Streptomyces sp. NRRL F-6602]MDI6410509.1 ATP-grasp peptide maturase system methyltransferase [Streptomyces albus]
MTEPDVESIAAGLRRQLADRLAAAGRLRSPGWRAAVEAVPRHELVPRFYAETDAPGLTTWVPVTPELVGLDEWLRLAYADETLITQFDGREIDWADPQPVSDAHPTSSSTLPSLVVRMLEDLRVEEGHRVTEYGTGTGYSTALMCHYLADDRVTSVETDPHVSARADANLARCGYRPRLLIGDGLGGAPGCPPAHRTIATMGVRSIPAAWVRQTRPGGLIVATLRGWMRSLGLVRLTVEDEHTAHGRFLTGDPTFMMARQQDAPASFGMLPAPDEGATRDTRYGPEVLTMPDSGFVAQLALPHARHFSLPADDGTVSTYVLDARNDAFAVLTPDGDGWAVRQGGRVLLWDAIEQALALWQDAASPGPTGFGLTVTPDAQHVWLAAPDGPSWRLPA